MNATSRTENSQGNTFRFTWFWLSRSWHRVSCYNRGYYNSGFNSHLHYSGQRLTRMVGQSGLIPGYATDWCPGLGPGGPGSGYTSVKKTVLTILRRSKLVLVRHGCLFQILQVLPLKIVILISFHSVISWFHLWFLKKRTRFQVSNPLNLPFEVDVTRSHLIKVTAQ